MPVSEVLLITDQVREFRNRAERHLVEVGFRDPQDIRPRKDPPSSGADDQKGHVPIRPFAAAFVLAPVLQIGPVLYFQMLGTTVFQHDLGLIGLPVVVLAGLMWLIGSAAAIGLPVYLTAGLVVAWRTLRRLQRPTVHAAARALAERAFVTNLATAPIYIVVGLMIGVDGGGLFGLALGIFALGMLFAPLQGAILGALYGLFLPKQPTGDQP